MLDTRRRNALSIPNEILENRCKCLMKCELYAAAEEDARAIIRNDDSSAEVYLFIK